MANWSTQVTPARKSFAGDDGEIKRDRWARGSGSHRAHQIPSGCCGLPSHGGGRNVAPTAPWYNSPFQPISFVLIEKWSV